MTNRRRILTVEDIWRRLVYSSVQHLAEMVPCACREGFVELRRRRRGHANS